MWNLCTSCLFGSSYGHQILVCLHDPLVSDRHILTKINKTFDLAYIWPPEHGLAYGRLLITFVGGEVDEEWSRPWQPFRRYWRWPYCRWWWRRTGFQRRNVQHCGRTGDWFNSSSLESSMACWTHASSLSSSSSSSFILGGATGARRGGSRACARRSSFGTVHRARQEPLVPV